MRFVGVKPVSQHLQQWRPGAIIGVKDRSAHGNQIQGFLLEYGIALPKGLSSMLKRLNEVLEDRFQRVADGRPSVGFGPGGGTDAIG